MSLLFVLILLGVAVILVAVVCVGVGGGLSRPDNLVETRDKTTPTPTEKTKISKRKRLKQQMVEMIRDSTQDLTVQSASTLFDCLTTLYERYEKDDDTWFDSATIPDDTPDVSLAVYRGKRYDVYIDPTDLLYVRRGCDSFREFRIHVDAEKTPRVSKLLQYMELRDFHRECCFQRDDSLNYYALRIIGHAIPHRSPLLRLQIFVRLMVHMPHIILGAERENLPFIVKEARRLVDEVNATDRLAGYECIERESPDVVEYVNLLSYVPDSRAALFSTPPLKDSLGDHYFLYAGMLSDTHVKLPKRSMSPLVLGATAVRPHLDGTVHAGHWSHSFFACSHKDVVCAFTSTSNDLLRYSAMDSTRSTLCTMLGLSSTVSEYIEELPNLINSGEKVYLRMVAVNTAERRCTFTNKRAILQKESSYVVEKSDGVQRYYIFVYIDKRLLCVITDSWGNTFNVRRNDTNLRVTFTTPCVPVLTYAWNADADDFQRYLYTFDHVARTLWYDAFERTVGLVFPGDCVDNASDTDGGGEPKCTVIDPIDKYELLLLTE